MMFRSLSQGTSYDVDRCFQPLKHGRQARDFCFFHMKILGG